MRNILLIIILFASSITYAEEIFKINYTNESNVQIPAIRKFKTNNQLQLLYIKDDLPQFTIIAHIGYGKLFENKNNAGVSDILVKTLKFGGSLLYPGDKLEKKLDELGGKISISSGWEGLTISIQVLQEHAEQVSEILAKLIEEPNFDDSSFKLAKSLQIEKIKRSKDDPFLLAYENGREIMFQSQGYGIRETTKTINSIQKQDIQDIWKKYVCSKNMIIGVSSSVPFKKVKNILNKKFKFLKQGAHYSYKVEVDLEKYKNNANKVFFVSKNIPQATIVMGSPAPSITHEDRYVLTVMNEILGGGGFNSKLMQEIRVKRGLAYTTGSLIRFRKNTGIFLMYAQVSTEKVTQTYKIMNKLVKDMSNKKVADKEFNHSISALTNSFIFQFDTTLNVLSKYLSFWYYGLPDQVLKEFPQKIKNVNKNQIIQKTKKLVNNGLVTVIVGNAELKKKLSKVYEVVEIKE